MLEKRGIPTEGLRPKKLEEIPLKELDYVVVLCAEKKCPNILNVKKKSRATPNPAKVKGTPKEWRRYLKKP